MKPTIDEQLEGIARLVERVVERHPDDPSVSLLRNGTGTLRRMARAWSEILPFLTWDNRAMCALFDRFDADLPEAMRTELRALKKVGIDPLSARDVEARNRAFRAVLAHWVRSLPPGSELLRSAITTHCRDRIARDPSSGRTRSSTQAQEAPS